MLNMASSKLFQRIDTYDKNYSNSSANIDMYVGFYAYDNHKYVV